jgi:hypothetical protein
MPKGPQGQRRPTDVVSNAVHVMRIATGEITETDPPCKSVAAEMGARGGRARAANLKKDERTAIARKAANKRWGKPG